MHYYWRGLNLLVFQKTSINIEQNSLHQYQHTFVNEQVGSLEANSNDGKSSSSSIEITSATETLSS